jgi:hypothetical protein
MGTWWYSVSSSSSTLCTNSLKVMRRLRVVVDVDVAELESIG